MFDPAVEKGWRPPHMTYGLVGLIPFLAPLSNMNKLEPESLGGLDLAN